MSLDRRRFVIAAVAAAAGAQARAQAAYPSQPVRWIVPYAAGGGTDIVARTVSMAMAPALGQTIVVDNRPGANTAIGAAAIAQAAADGYTVGSADNATLALNQHLFAKLAYRPAQDFVFVGGLARFPYALLVHPSQEIRSFQELVETGRKEPRKLSYGTPGLGGPNHVAMELIQQRTGAQFVHIPYKGAAPGLQDLVAGQIQFMLVDTASSMPFIKAGKVRAIAVASSKRLSVLPELPTIAEAGLADFEAFSWQGLIAPAATPRPIVERLGAELMKTVRSDEVGRRLAEIGVEPAPASSEAFTAQVRQQAELWGGVIRQAGIRLEG